MLAAAGLVLLTGCRGRGSYTTTLEPQVPLSVYERVEIAPVTVEITTDPLDASTPSQLGFAIAEAFRDDGWSVGPTDGGGLRIACEITEYELAGLSAGVMIVECDFIDAASSDVIARGNFFGASDGAIDPMTEDIAFAMRRFVEQAGGGR